MDLIGMIDVPVYQEFADQLVIGPVPENVFGIDTVLHKNFAFLTNSDVPESVCPAPEFEVS